MERGSASFVRREASLIHSIVTVHELASLQGRRMRENKPLTRAALPTIKLNQVQFIMVTPLKTTDDH